MIRETLALNNKTQEDLWDQIRNISAEVDLYTEATYRQFNSLDTEVAMSESMAINKMLESEHKRLTSQIMQCLEDTVPGKITQLIP